MKCSVVFLVLLFSARIRLLSLVSTSLPTHLSILLLSEKFSNETSRNIKRLFAFAVITKKGMLLLKCVTTLRKWILKPGIIPGREKVILHSKQVLSQHNLFYLSQFEEKGLLQTS